MARLCGLSEIAERAHTTTAAVTMWRKRHRDFPPPIVSLTCGPIYDWLEVQDWITKRAIAHITP